MRCLVFSFWSYLWGIETDHSFQIFLSSPSFWSYLWGIEMRKQRTNPYRNRSVLILPMRNCWLKAWFFVLYHSQLYKSPDKIPFIYFLKFFAFFPLFFLTFLCKISIISIFVLNFWWCIKFCVKHFTRPKEKSRVFSDLDQHIPEKGVPYLCLNVYRMSTGQIN